MSRQLPQAGLVNLLESDPRPTFVVTLLGKREQSTLPEIVYRNPSLGAYPQLLDLLVSHEQENHHNFWDWVAGQSLNLKLKGDHGPTFTYANMTWTKSVVEDMWIVVGANDEPPSLEPRRKIRQQAPAAVQGSRQKEGSSSSTSTDMGRRPQPGQRTSSDSDGQMVASNLVPDEEPFLDVVNSVDWDASPLGPIDKWHPRLRQTFRQIISDSRPIAIYWGEEMSILYNEAYSKLCGSKHPSLLGKPATNIWPDSDLFEKTVAEMGNPTQQARVEDETRIFIETSEGLVETYVRWSVVPIVEGEECLGFMHPLLETTSTRLWERRMKMLIELGDNLVTARDVKSYWGKVLEQLEACDPMYDIPLAILYSVSDDCRSSSLCGIKDGCPKICTLEWSFGVPSGHPIAPQTLCPDTSEAGLSAMLREAFRTPHPVFLQTRDGSLPRHLLEGLEWRGFKDACDAAIICPITPTREESVMGLLVLGLNPRRPYDNDYRQYVSLLCQKLTTSLASTVLLEEERRRGRNAAEQAAFDQAMLEEKLARSTREANESMERFMAVAEFIPVGMCFGDDDGNITFANDAWYRITGHPSGPVVAGSFQSCVIEEDLPVMARAYQELHNVSAVTFEFRVKRGRNSPPIAHKSPVVGGRAGKFNVVDERVARHVLASAKAERYPDGSIKQILTCLTDVTEHKESAEEAVRRAHEAENLKRMAELATVGMYDMDLDGCLLGANKVFYELCGVSKVDDLTKTTVKPWETCIFEADRPVLQQCLTRLVEDGKSQTAEIRLKTIWTLDDGKGNEVAAPRWVLATFMPVRGSDDAIHSITGCLSDVSAQKWQLETERQRKEEAIESKRQQENFIDMTSHEMRNPLGAIIHCADAIAASLTRVQELQSASPMTPTQSHQPNPGKGKDVMEEKRLVDESIDNAETIVTCAQHQKRIVDDILTMSKLDSKLLAVTPCTVDAVHLARDALKMFDVEARRVDINLSLTVDKSYKELGHTFLDFDPSRVRQVLINLLTNALKFTKSNQVREVSIQLKASKTRPTEASSSGVRFIPRSCSKESEYDQPALKGRTNPLFLIFEVKDSGRGLSQEEMSNLFNKFQQASSRTHIKYGGSGLGLFISRRLTELQNGAIGVSSERGAGSTFAFFIEAFVPSEKAIREAAAAASAASATVSSESGGETSAASTLSPRPWPGRPERQSPGGNSRIDGILIVEDNIINQQITRRGLVDRAFAVDVANHGVEALEKLEASRKGMPLLPRASSSSISLSSSSSPSSGGPEKEAQKPIPFNLILMDIEMPIQDGLTCTRRIRQLEREGQTFSASGGRIPIIAVSANARPEQILEAKKAGCDDVLVKPYRMPELIEKMQVVIRRMDGLSPNSPPR